MNRNDFCIFCGVKIYYFNLVRYPYHPTDEPIEEMNKMKKDS